MKGDIRRTIENTYAAAAFAEAGEHETAMKMAGITATAKTAFDKVVSFVDRHMSAVSFAEAACFEEAEALLGEGPRRKRDSLENFLENVGLRQVNVRFGWATVDI